MKASIFFESKTYAHIESSFYCHNNIYCITITVLIAYFKVQLSVKDRHTLLIIINLFQ